MKVDRPLTKPNIYLYLMLFDCAKYKSQVLPDSIKTSVNPIYPTPPQGQFLSGV